MATREDCAVASDGAHWLFFSTLREGLLGLCPLRGGGAGRGANAGYFSPSYHRGLADADILQLKGKSQRCYFKQSISPLLCWQSQKQCQQQNHVLKANEAFLAIAMVL